MDHSKVNVQKKSSQLFRFLKQSNAFDSFKELSKRKEISIECEPAFHDKSYTRKEIIPDYLLILNKKDAKYQLIGKSIGIAIVYLGLTQEESYFIVSVSDYKVDSGSHGFSERKINYNTHYSFKMNYEEFSDKLRVFNKFIRNSSDHSNIIETFSETMGIFDPKNEAKREEIKNKLIEEHNTLQNNISESEKTVFSLEKKYKKQAIQIRKKLGTIDLERQEEQLLHQLKKIKQEIENREKTRIEELAPLKQEIENEAINLEQLRENRRKIEREAQLVNGNKDFLK